MVRADIVAATATGGGDRAGQDRAGDRPRRRSRQRPCEGLPLPRKAGRTGIANARTAVGNAENSLPRHACNATYYAAYPSAVLDTLDDLLFGIVTLTRNKVLYRLLTAFLDRLDGDLTTHPSERAGTGQASEPGTGGGEIGTGTGQASEPGMIEPEIRSDFVLFYQCFLEFSAIADLQLGLTPAPA